MTIIRNKISAKYYFFLVRRLLSVTVLLVLACKRATLFEADILGSNIAQVLSSSTNENNSHYANREYK